MSSMLSHVSRFLSDPETQLKRLMERNNYTKEQAQQRFASQMTLNEKCQWANYVVDNSRSSAETLKQVEKIHKELISSWAFLRLRVAFLIVLTGIVLVCYSVIQGIWY